MLKFNPTQRPNAVPLFNSPILLSFLCLLVREEAIDLSNTEVAYGEIYFRMVRCLYKKFTIRKGIEFKTISFLKVLKLFGKLALHTLTSGNSLLRYSQIVAEVDSNVFDYGLLIGHEDTHRLIQYETADLCVTFADPGIQEFLGAFYFICLLDGGRNITSLLGSYCRKPIFLMNPMFLHFCLLFSPHDDMDVILASYPALLIQGLLIARFRRDIYLNLCITGISRTSNRRSLLFNERSFEMYTASTSTKQTELTSEATSKFSKGNTIFSNF